MKSLVISSVMLRSELISKIEIEIRLVPGLPGLRILGLPDASLKESELRIRSAIRASGFQLPRGRQILVDLKPRDERKQGRGIDLPIAIGFLILSGQTAIEDWRTTVFYGDLGLGGQVSAPRDWERVRRLIRGPMMTGDGPIARGFRAGRDGEGVTTISNLGEISFFKYHEPREVNQGTGSSGESGSDSGLGVPLAVDMKFTDDAADIIELAALGGLPTLLAGPPGSGKSTIARAIHRLRPPVSAEEAHEIECWSRGSSGANTRPLEEPHHTASQIAMVGGGSPPRPGLITRAHRGTLLMDEVLLFRPEVQESLREPLETGMVQLSRGSESRNFPADFLLLGTANLCACGHWTPGKSDGCTCSSRVRSQYETRLRGPFVDRFQILAFTTDKRPSQGKRTTQSIEEKIALGEAFRKKCGRELSNRFWRPSASETRGLRLPVNGSERRRLAVLRVARTLADIEQKAKIEDAHIMHACRWALDSFLLLRGYY